MVKSAGVRRGEGGVGGEGGGGVFHWFQSILLECRHQSRVCERSYLSVGPGLSGAAEGLSVGGNSGNTQVLKGALLPWSVPGLQ